MPVQRHASTKLITYTILCYNNWWPHTEHCKCKNAQKNWRIVICFTTLTNYWNSHMLLNSKDILHKQLNITQSRALMHSNHEETVCFYVQCTCFVAFSLLDSAGPRFTWSSCGCLTISLISKLTLLVPLLLNADVVWLTNWLIWEQQTHMATNHLHLNVTVY